MDAESAKKRTSLRSNGVELGLLAGEFGLLGHTRNGAGLWGFPLVGTCLLARATATDNSLSSERLAFRLDRVQLFILSAVIEQFSVGPGLNHLAVIHRVDPVGILNRRQPVSDGDHRVVPVHRFNPRLHTSVSSVSLIRIFYVQLSNGFPK